MRLRDGRLCKPDAEIRKFGGAIPPRVFRPCVRVVANQLGRFVPPDAGRLEAASTRAGSGSSRAQANFPGAASAAVMQPHRRPAIAEEWD